MFLTLEICFLSLINTPRLSNFILGIALSFMWRDIKSIYEDGNRQNILIQHGLLKIEDLPAVGQVERKHGPSQLNP